MTSNGGTKDQPKPEPKAPEPKPVARVELPPVELAPSAKAFLAEQQMTATPAMVGKAKKPEPKKAPKAVRAFCYIGPTLPPALAPLPQYICFSNEIPKQLEPVFGLCPSIKELIVPTTDLARARVAMATPGTREHTLSVAVQKFLATPPPTAPEEETVEV